MLPGPAIYAILIEVKAKLKVWGPDEWLYFVEPTGLPSTCNGVLLCSILSRVCRYAYCLFTPHILWLSPARETACLLHQYEHHPSSPSLRSYHVVVVVIVVVLHSRQPPSTILQVHWYYKKEKEREKKTPDIVLFTTIHSSFPRFVVRGECV
jgi:hypothetical protein